MTSIARLNVDLRLPAERRWAGLRKFVAQAQRLTDSYTRDLGDDGTIMSMLGLYRDGFVRTVYAQEMASVAARIDRSLDEVLVANLYYDAMQALIGCTAFAVDTPSGPLHARNLDWWTEGHLLRDDTLLCDFEVQQMVLQASTGVCEVRLPT